MTRYSAPRKLRARGRAEDEQTLDWLGRRAAGQPVARIAAAAGVTPGLVFAAIAAVQRDDMASGDPPAEVAAAYLHRTATARGPLA